MQDSSCVSDKRCQSEVHAVRRQYRSWTRTLALRSDAGKIGQGWAVGVFSAILLSIGNPGTAVALPITGDIGFASIFRPTNNSFASAPLADATGIDFNSNGIQDVGLGIVTLATGDFASFAPVFSPVSLSDFIFNPLAAGGVSPLWSAGGFSFALDSISINTQNAGTLSLVGTGTVSGNNFAASMGTWNFTGNPIGKSSFIFSWGTTTVATIPEPATYALMGVGIALIGCVGRKRGGKAIRLDTNWRRSQSFPGRST